MAPPRKSAAYLKLTGSPAGNGRGIALPPSTPPKPDWLGPVASAVWDQTIEDLQEIPGLLTTLDGGTLALYCDSWQQYKDAAAIVSRCGMVATGEKGGEYQHPAVGIRNKARDAIVKLGAKFGLDPQSREGIVVSGRTPDGELEDLIR